MTKIPLILFFVALSITIPTMIILYDSSNDSLIANGEEQKIANGEEQKIQIGGKYSEYSVDPEPTDCVGMSSVDRILCKKLDKIIENQQVLFDNQEEIFDLISFWQEYISGIRK